MASLDHTAHAATAAPRAQAAGLFADLRAALTRRAMYTRTLRELRSLSDRELADLGLNRTELKRVAWEAANDF